MSHAPVVRARNIKNVMEREVKIVRIFNNKKRKHFLKCFLFLLNGFYYFIPGITVGKKVFSAVI